MHSHPYFDLLLHDDGELETLLGCGLRERVTLHEWPLSCVQRLTLVDGRRWIYKIQRPPSVEGAFYAQARSALLPQTQTIFQNGVYTCLLQEYLDAPTLKGSGLAESQILQVGRELCAQIAALPTDLPCFLDISTLARWREVMQFTLDNLASSITQGLYRQLTLADVSRLEEAAFSPEVTALYPSSPCLTHGDLTLENVFLLPDGLRVIDWQRPLLAPPGIDWVTFLHSAGLQVERYAGSGVIRMRRMLLVNWLSEATRMWFPPGAEVYDRQISEIAKELSSVS